jgi:hypothetical protein
MVAPDAEMALTDTHVFCPAKELELGVEVVLNDVFPADPG